MIKGYLLTKASLMVHTLCRYFAKKTSSLNKNLTLKALINTGKNGLVRRNIRPKFPSFDKLATTFGRPQMTSKMNFIYSFLTTIGGRKI